MSASSALSTTSKSRYAQPTIITLIITLCDDENDEDDEGNANNDKVVHSGDDVDDDDDAADDDDGDDDGDGAGSGDVADVGDEDDGEASGGPYCKRPILTRVWRK